MRILIIYFALCIAISHAYNVRDRILKPFQAGGRVIQGEPAVKGQFPHMALLSMGCGGALIDAKWVLTAAHCLDPSSPPVVYLGDVESTKMPVSVRVSKVHNHPEYSYPLNDISLLELEDSVTFTDNIKPIRIPTSPDDRYVGEVVTISGFGQTQNVGSGSSLLQYADLIAISRDECLRDSMYHIFEDVLCARGIKSPSQGICFGDSGSGLVHRGPDGDTVVGIAAFLTSEECEDPNPSGFIRVNNVLDWIKETTGL